MSAVKDKIKNNVPDDALEVVLRYLESIQNKTADDIRLSNNLNKILKEDSEVLDRLAQ